MLTASREPEIWPRNIYKQKMPVEMNEKKNSGEESSSYRNYHWKKLDFTQLTKIQHFKHTLGKYRTLKIHRRLWREKLGDPVACVPLKFLLGESIDPLKEA